MLADGVDSTKAQMKTNNLTSAFQLSSIFEDRMPPAITLNSKTLFFSKKLKFLISSIGGYLSPFLPFRNIIKTVRKDCSSSGSLRYPILHLRMMLTLTLTLLEITLIRVFISIYSYSSFSLSALQVTFIHVNIDFFRVLPRQNN